MNGMILEDGMNTLKQCIVLIEVIFLDKIVKIYNKFFSFISQNIFYIKESVLYFIYKKNLKNILKKKKSAGINNCTNI